MNKFKFANQAVGYFDALYGKRTYAQFQRYDNLIRGFKKRFKQSYCYLASAPGRVEFIGNHTDHNGGKVIGCAVNLDIAGAFKPNGSSKVRMLSNGYSAIEFDVNEPPQLKGGVGLAEGVINYLKQAGYKVSGFDLFTHSNVPSGAGVSSSAAFEILIASIVNFCFNDCNIPAEFMAKAGQYAENKYLNKPCGLLDQGASLSGGMTLFDFSDGFNCLRLNADGSSQLRFVLIDTGKSHSGLSNLYATIPTEMFSVAQYFGKDRLIDVASSQLYDSEREIRLKLGDRPYLRAKHFVEENARVELTMSALGKGNVDEIIKLINSSGDSSLYQLQNCAVDERDTAIAEAISYARSLGDVGARVHGGGYAGTILCVVKVCDFKNCVLKMSEKYGKQRVIPMTVRQIGATVL